MWFVYTQSHFFLLTYLLGKKRKHICICFQFTAILFVLQLGIYYGIFYVQIGKIGVTTVVPTYFL